MKKYIALIITAFFIALPGSAQRNDAVIEKLADTYTVKPDGSTVMNHKKQVKILTHRAFNNLYGETFVVYNPQFQKLTINKSYTRMADGKIVQAPKNAFNESLPHMAARAPQFAGLREMVITHTALEIGATIYLDYTIETKPGFLASGSFLRRFDMKDPVRDYTLRFAAPAEQLYLAQNVGRDAKESVEGGSRVAEFRFRDIPGIKDRDVAPAAIPYVYASVYGSEESARRIATFKQLKVVRDRALESSLDKAGSAGEKAEIVCAFAAALDNNSTTLEALGKLRCPACVVRSGYGTPMEKAVLMASVLKMQKVDFESYLVFAPVLPVCVQSLDYALIKVDGKFYNPVSGKVVDIDRVGAAHKVVGADGRVLETRPYMMKVEEKKAVRLSELSSEKAGRFVVVNIPDAARMNQYRFYSRRNEAFGFDYCIDAHIEYTIDLEGRKLVSPDFETELKNSVGEVRISISGNADKVVARRELKILKQTISVGEYRQLLALMKIWNDHRGSRLVFE